MSRTMFEDAILHDDSRCMARPEWVPTWQRVMATYLHFPLGAKPEDRDEAED